jgi:predicted nuclease of predicted toxin-antitoxin system
MKPLLDENLPHGLADSLQDYFPGSQHVRKIGLKGQSDRLIWEYAKKHGYIIASKDSDFNERALLLGSPPRVVWLRIGNCTRQDLEKLLMRNREILLTWESKSDEVVLEL